MQKSIGLRNGGNRGWISKYESGQLGQNKMLGGWPEGAFFQAAKPGPTGMGLERASV